VKLYDAFRCPFCARVRIACAEKELAYEPVAIDLSDRPAWLYDLNPLGKVPVLDDDGFVLPESEVIMQYLDDRFPETAQLLPEDPRTRAEALLAVYRFDDLFGDDYYAFRRNESNRLAERLDALELGHSLFVDIAYAPWVMRSRDMLGLALPGRLEDGLARLTERPGFAIELEIVQAL
jgi:glutathione S-transferase